MTQERAKATRQHILGTAAKLFGQRGIANTTTNRIAAEAGISIGTLYRHFSDRTAIVEELLARLLDSVEQRLAESTSGPSPQPMLELTTTVLGAITDELVANARLVRALVAGVQFYNSCLPEFEPRLRAVVKSLLLHALGTDTDTEYDIMAFVLVNTGFAAVLRTAVMEDGNIERHEILGMTARMIAAWTDAEHKPERPAVQARKARRSGSVEQEMSKLS